MSVDSLKQARERDCVHLLQAVVNNYVARGIVKRTCSIDDDLNERGVVQPVMLNIMYSGEKPQVQ